MASRVSSIEVADQNLVDAGIDKARRITDFDDLALLQFFEVIELGDDWHRFLAGILHWNPGVERRQPRWIGQQPPKEMVKGEVPRHDRCCSKGSCLVTAKHFIEESPFLDAGNLRREV